MSVEVKKEKISDGKKKSSQENLQNLSKVCILLIDRVYIIQVNIIIIKLFKVDESLIIVPREENVVLMLSDDEEPVPLQPEPVETMPPPLMPPPKAGTFLLLYIINCSKSHDLLK